MAEKKVKSKFGEEIDHEATSKMVKNGETTFINSTTATEYNEITSEIIKDAETIFMSNKPKRHKAMFFRLMMAGATCVIADILSKEKHNAESHKNNNDKELLYKWMLGWSSNDEKSHTHKPIICNHKFLTILKYLILLPVWVIITPLFYLIDSLIGTILNSKQLLHRFSISKYEKLDFPLAFAVFSGEEDMVKLFMSHNVPIDLTDVKGHNVIHYLADLSQYDLAKALKCYEVLWKMTQTGEIQRETLCRMIESDENIHKQNAIEYCCQFGGLKLACKMIHDAMTTHKMTIENKLVTFVKSERNHKISDIRYSTKDMLSSFSFGNTNNTSRLDSKQDNDDKGERKNGTTGWTVKRMDITRYSASPRHGFMSFILCLINSRPAMSVSKKNWKSVHEDQGMQKWRKLKWDQWWCTIVFLIILELAVTVFIVFFLISTQGDMFFTPNKELFVTRHIQIFLSKWQKNETTTTGIDTNLRTSFFSAYSDLEQSLAQDKNRMDYTEMLGLINKLDGYQDYSFFNLTKLYNELCITGSIYKLVGDFVQMDNCTVPAVDLLLSDCSQSGSKYMYYFVRESWNPEELVIASSFRARIFNDKTTVFKNPYYRILPQWLINFFCFTIVVYLSVYLVVDIWCRLAILYYQIRNDCTLFSIFATPLPGSYLKGHCKVFGGFAFLLLIFYYSDSILNIYGEEKTTNLKNDILGFDRFSYDNITTNFFMSVMLVFLTLCRIILHLHSMRLWPVIGNFIITTFEMATDLFQFTVGYLLIVIVFSALFFWFSRSSTCPFFRDENNINFGTSMFSTFAVAFGHVELSFSTLQLRIVYVVFVGLSIILLLNLIIAVMSSTASDVRLEPWKTQLYHEALNKDALGIEQWIAGFFFYNKNLVHWLLKRAGFIVESNCKTSRDQVFIEYFEEKVNKGKKTHHNDD